MSVSKFSSSLTLVFDPKYTSDSLRKDVQRIIVTLLGRRLYRSDEKETKKTKKLKSRTKEIERFLGVVLQKE